MSASLTTTQRIAAGMAVLVVWASFTGASSGRDSATADDDVKLIRTGKLPNVPGRTLSVVIVNYPPDGKSRRHHHAGSVYAYVQSGAIRSENSATGPVKVYKAGESFFEPPGSTHLISENASATKPASLLAVFIADDGAQLTTFDCVGSAPPPGNK
jgi:quercetin dioxygenase-like cupin family protein